MPRLPKPIDLAPPADASPLTRRELQEARAIRMALALTTAVLHAEGFSAGYIGIPTDCYGRCAWLRQRLLPLTVCSPTVRAICGVYEPEFFARAWLDAACMRWQLAALTRRAQSLARRLAAPPRGR